MDGFGVNEEVRLIDLRGHPELDVSDVDFDNIPIGTGIALSIPGVTNMVGFQQASYAVTESRHEHISVAFPGVLDPGRNSLRIQASIDADSEREESLVRIGSDMLLHGDDRDVIYYWPIYVTADAENDVSWEFEIEFAGTATTYSDREGQRRPGVN